MSAESFVRDHYGASAHRLFHGIQDSELASDLDWYRIITQIMPSIGFIADNGRMQIRVDLAELKRLLPTGSLIAIQESQQATLRPTTTATSTPEDRRYQRWLTLPLHAQLAEVSAALSLNKTQLAEVLDVSRPTIYQWMDEQRVVADERTDTSRLTTLLRLMAQAGISGTEPLNARFTKVPLDIHGKGLLALLFEKTWDEARVLAGLIQARDITRAAQRERAEREARLVAQGFSTPTAEERDANLDRALFLEGLDTP